VKEIRAYRELELGSGSQGERGRNKTEFVLLVASLLNINFTIQICFLSYYIN